MPIEMTDPSYGGFEHRFWVSNVCRNLQKRGLAPIEEYSKDTRRADLGCYIDGKLVAIEIGTSDARNEIRNIKGDLKAGFDRVWVICTDKIHKDLLRRVSTELDADAKGKVKIDLTYTYYDGKAKLPEKRKVLLVRDGSFPKATEELKSRLSNTSLKTLPLDDVKDEHLSWADEIMVMDKKGEQNLRKKFPDAKAKVLHLDKDVPETIFNKKLFLFLGA